MCQFLGKFIIAYAPLWGEKEYYLGCACEELYAPPSAYFSLYGLTAQAQFLGGKYWYLNFQLKFSISQQNAIYCYWYFLWFANKKIVLLGLYSAKFQVTYATAIQKPRVRFIIACLYLYLSISKSTNTPNQSVVRKGVLEKVGVQPQVQRIGKYKSAGDQLTRKNISEENREVLTTLLDNIYGNWVDKISQAKGEVI